MIVASPVAALPPVGPDSAPDIDRASAGQQSAASPGRSAALPINFTTSVSDGAAAGRFPNGWECGVVWRPEGCRKAHVWLHECDPLQETCPNPDIKEQAEDVDCQTSWPFDIYFPDAADRCGPGEDPKAVAARELASQTATWLAYAAEMQVRAAALADETADISGGACPCIEPALGLLVAARVRSGAAGATLWIPDHVVPVAESLGVIRRVGGRYVGPFDAPVIVGPGLTGAAPDGTAPAPGTAWIYATGPVDYAVGQVEQMMDGQNFDRLRQNKVDDALAERRAIVRVDGSCVKAIKVTVTGQCCPEGEG